MNIKFSIKKIIIASLVYATLDTMWMVYNSYVPIYLQAGNPAFIQSGVALLGFGLSPLLAGVILTLDNISSLILFPIIGVLSDGSKSRWGRRKPFILFPAIFLIVALIAAPLLPSLIPAELNGQTSALMHLLIPFVLLILVMLLANAIMWGPARALVFDITPSEQRTTANGITNVIVGIFNIVVVLGGAFLLSIFQPLPFWTIAFFVLVAVLLTMLFVREPQSTDSSALEHQSLKPREILDLIRSLPKGERNNNLLFLASILLFNLAVAIVQAFITSYAVTDLKIDSGTASLLLGIFVISVMLCSIPAALLANRFGRKRMMLIGMALCSLVAVALFLIKGVVFAFVCVVFFGIGFIFTSISHAPMVADRAPSSALTGTYLSIFFTVLNLGYILGPIIGGWVITTFNNNYRMIWPLMAVVFILALLVMIPVTGGEAKKAQEI